MDDLSGSFTMGRQALVPARVTTGIYVAEMASFDRIITNLMEKWRIPGGVVAVVKDGRLVLARGYGIADMMRHEPVQPDSLFRIASLSKQITAAAILRLMEEGRLGLEDKAFCILDHLQPPAGGATTDPRIRDITIRQLLQHSGGWDRDRGFDPMFISHRVAQAIGTSEPASSETIIRFMLGQPLDFDPGTQYAYSNFGYCVLGRVIEKVTERTYYEYVRSQLLEPLGITRMRLGRSLLKDRAEEEVHYYDYPTASGVVSVFPDVSGRVPSPYGGFHLEAMDAHGGWIGSVIDLMRFVTALDGSRPVAILKPKNVSLMVSRPAPPLWVGTSYYHGMGWLVRPVRNDANWWHTGSLRGTAAILVRTYDGLAWVALFNSRPKDRAGFLRELDDARRQATREVANWPTHDLFGQYASR